MAKKVEVDIDVKSNLDGSIAQLKELKLQLKQTAAGSAEFKKLYGQIDDLEDKIKSAKGASADWVDTLESAGGPLGALGGAINKAKVATKSFGAAFKAIGIGFLVAAVAGLVGAFTETEGSMKKLEPIMTAFQKILGGIFEAIQPLLDAFIELVTWALPGITTGIKGMYATLVALFTLLKEAGTGAGKILKGIFTLDTDAITEGYEQIKGSLGKTVDAFNKSVVDFDKGYAKQTKGQKKSAEELKAIADKAFQEKLKRMEAEDKLDEAALEKLKAEALSLADTEQKKLDVEKLYAEKSYQLKKKELDDKQALYEKNSVEYITLQADIIKLDADNITKKTELNEKQKAIDKDASDKAKEILEKRLKDQQDYDKYLYEQYQKLIELDQQRADAAFAANQAIGESWASLGNNIANVFGNLISVFEDGSDLAKAFGVAQVAISTAASIGTILLSGKQQQADYNKAIAAGNSTIGIGIANAFIPGMQGLAAGQLLSGKAAVAGAIAGKAISKTNTIAQVAAAGVAGATQIAAILSAGKSKGVSSGAAASSGGGSQATPTYGGAPTMTTPQITGTEAASPGSQIAQTIAASSGKPVRAYVVSGDISSQQALDRKTNRGATFGLG
jgi:hypothetical protein